MNTFVDLYDAQEEMLEESLLVCEDVKAASDCVENMLEGLFAAYAHQRNDIDRERMKALCATAQTAFASVGAVNHSKVYEVVRSRKTKGFNYSKLLTYLPCALMACISIVLYFENMTDLAMVALASSVLSVVMQFERMQTRDVEFDVRLTMCTGELFRRLRALMHALDEAVMPVAQLALPGELPRPLLEGMQMLLEARLTDDGDYALKSIPRLSHALEGAGVEFSMYNGDNAMDFDLLASAQKGGNTIRPAVYSDGKLILRGQATTER